MQHIPNQAPNLEYQIQLQHLQDKTMMDQLIYIFHGINYQISLQEVNQHLWQLQKAGG
jgi:hypothetical protein